MAAGGRMKYTDMRVVDNEKTLAGTWNSYVCQPHIYNSVSTSRKHEAIYTPVQTLPKPYLLPPKNMTEQDDATMTFAPPLPPPLSPFFTPHHHNNICTPPPLLNATPLTPTRKTHTLPGTPEPQGSTPGWSCTRCTGCSSRPSRCRGTSVPRRDRSGRRRSPGDRCRRCREWESLSLREGPRPRVPRTPDRLFGGVGRW